MFTRRITHVIFDVDGTLINTTEVAVKLYKRIAAQFNAEVPAALLANAGRCLPKTFCEVMADEMNLPMTGEEAYSAFLVDLYPMIKTDLRLMPGVERLVTHLHGNGVQMAIATGSSSTYFAYTTARFGDFFAPGNYFSHIVCGTDDPEVIRNKPCGDIYELCASRFLRRPMAPQDVLVVEDEPSYANGAIEVGMNCLLVPDSARIGPFNTKADLVLPSLEYFRPEQLGLPPYS